MRQIQRAPGVSLYNAYFSSPFSHVCFLQTSSNFTTLLELWSLEQDSVLHRCSRWIQAWGLWCLTYTEVLSRSQGGCSQKVSNILLRRRAIYLHWQNMTWASARELGEQYDFMYNYFKVKSFCLAGFQFRSFKLSEGDFEGEMSEIQDKKIQQLRVSSKSTVPLHSLCFTILGAVHLPPQEKEEVIEAH